MCRYLYPVVRGIPATKVGFLERRMSRERIEGVGGRPREKGPHRLWVLDSEGADLGLPDPRVRDSLSGLEMNKPSPPAQSGPSSRSRKHPPRAVAGRSSALVSAPDWRGSPGFITGSNLRSKSERFGFFRLPPWARSSRSARGVGGLFGPSLLDLPQHPPADRRIFWKDSA